MDTLTNLFASRVRAQLLTLLFVTTDQELHVRELARRSGLAEATVRQELTTLARLEIVEARRSGNRLYYRANSRQPLYPDIRNIVLKANSLDEVLESEQTAGGPRILSGAASPPCTKGDKRMAPGSIFDREALAEVCRRHHVRRLSLFGSVLAGTDRPDSDVDLLVEFEPGKAPGLMGLAGIEAELSTLLAGRRVDLRTANDLSSYFRDEVARNAVVQYAA